MPFIPYAGDSKYEFPKTKNPLSRFWKLVLLGLVAEPPRPAEAEAGYLSGPAGLGGKIYGITSLVIIPAYNL